MDVTEPVVRTASGLVRGRRDAAGIAAGYESLHGVTIDSGQLVALAPYLARQLGITVEG